MPHVAELLVDVLDAVAEGNWPNDGEPCWDCGSTLPNRHTPLCEMAPEGAVRDLPQIPGTQWWNKEVMPVKSKEVELYEVYLEMLLAGGK